MFTELSVLLIPSFLEAPNFHSSFITVVSCIAQKSLCPRGVSFIPGQTSKRWAICEYLHKKTLLQMIPHPPDAWRAQCRHTGDIQPWSSHQRRLKGLIKKHWKRRFLESEFPVWRGTKSVAQMQNVAKDTGEKVDFSIELYNYSIWCADNS